jgi:hypothetical protein
MADHAVCVAPRRVVLRFLDVITGTLTCPWVSGDALRLSDGQERYLLASLATSASNGGMNLGPAEVYDFVQPPILGGSVAPDNLRPNDFVVAINIAGQ